METINTIGRRKTSVARLYMQPGNGDINVNGKAVADYFNSDVLEMRNPREPEVFPLYS